MASTPPPPNLAYIQALIEKCMILYLTPTEIAAELARQASIDPSVTQLVYEALEASNPDFFREYTSRVRCKEQIVLLNHYMEQHALLLNRMRNPSHHRPVTAKPPSVTGKRPHHAKSMHKKPSAAAPPPPPPPPPRLAAAKKPVVPPRVRESKRSKLSTMTRPNNPPPQLDNIIMTDLYHDELDFSELGGVNLLDLDV